MKFFKKQIKNGTGDLSFISKGCLFIASIIGLSKEFNSLPRPSDVSEWHGRTETGRVTYFG